MNPLVKYVADGFLFLFHYEHEIRMGVEEKPLSFEMLWLDGAGLMIPVPREIIINQINRGFHIQHIACLTLYHLKLSIFPFQCHIDRFYIVFCALICKNIADCLQVKGNLNGINFILMFQIFFRLITFDEISGLSDI